MAALVLLTPFVIFGNQSWGAVELAAAAFFRRGQSSSRSGRFVWLAGPATAAGPGLVAGHRRSSRAGQSWLAVRSRRLRGPETATSTTATPVPSSPPPGCPRPSSGPGASKASRSAPTRPASTRSSETLLDNEVQYLGVPGPHGGFVKTDSCEQFRDAVARGDYRYLVLTLDRENPDRAVSARDPVDRRRPERGRGLPYPADRGLRTRTARSTRRPAPEPRHVPASPTPVHTAQSAWN